MLTQDPEPHQRWSKKTIFSATACSAGIAIFSMFFGAGNVTFPLALGIDSGALVPMALFGLILTGVGSPLLGLFAAVLYEGDYRAFFRRIGSTQGFIVVLLIFALLGPFGAMPRCITVAYEAIHTYFPNLSLLSFSLISAVVSMIFIIKRDLILPILGWILSPLLLLCLMVIIVMGFFSPYPLKLIDINNFQVFVAGLSAGYDTMDLLASVFFSIATWNLLKEKLQIDNPIAAKQKLVPTCLSAAFIGGSLLAIIYVGLAWSAAANIPVLEGVVKTRLLPMLAIHVLGSNLAVLANLAIALACLTTVMGIAVTIADIIHVELKSLRSKKVNLSYNMIVFVVLVITAIMSNFGFMGIMKFIHPLMALCYPAIIVLTVCNILYKLFGFKYVKMPFYLTLGTTAFMQFI